MLGGEFVSRQAVEAKQYWKELGGVYVSLQFFDIKTRLGRCWAGFEFLVRRWCWDGVEKVRSRVGVSSCFLEKNIFQESAKQGIRF